MRVRRVVRLGPNGQSTPDRPRLGALINGLRREFANWYTLGPLAWIALPSRFPPTRGIRFLWSRGVTVKTRRGVRAECRLDEFFSFVEVYVMREYELPGFPWHEIKTIIDVGANVGAASLWLAERAPQATIIAVEPSSEASASLMRNLRANQLQGRVHLVSAALAPRTGRAYLHQSGPSVFGHTSPSASRESEEVPAISLTDLLNRFELAELDLLKLDCEGAEFEVLFACDDEVLRRIRFMVGEYHATETEVASLIRRLEDAGFVTSVSGNSAIGLFSAVRQ